VPFLLALVAYLVILFGGWRLVRGRGQGWRLLVWYSLIFGPIGIVIWILVRRGTRIGTDLGERS
jgi:hypothetical protein